MIAKPFFENVPQLYERKVVCRNACPTRETEIDTNNRDAADGQGQNKCGDQMSRKGSGPRVRIGNNHVGLPRSRIARISIGIVLILGGILGFLPVLGFWMIPLGLFVLSQDLPMVRRWRRRLSVKWGRRKNGREK